MKTPSCIDTPPTANDHHLALASQSQLLVDGETHNRLMDRLTVVPATEEQS